MDAQYRREHGCHQHLHGQRHPADEKAYGHPTRHRPAIQMPDHRLSNSVPNPASQDVRFFVCTANLVIQLTSESRRIRQMSFQPLTAHDRYIDEKNRTPQHNNVVAEALLNFSLRNDG